MNDADAADLLARALAAVEAAKVPDDLREVAFSSALMLLSGASSSAAPAPTSGGFAAPHAAAATGLKASTGSPLLDKVADGLSLPGEQIKRIFAEKDGAPRLIVKSSRLPKTKAAAAADIALLVMASRQLAGLDDYTESEIIREAVRQYGKFDATNFATQMKRLDNFILTDGKGVSVKRKLTHPGIEAATTLAERYASDE